MLVESELVLEHARDFDAVRDRWERDLKDFIDRTLEPIISDSRERRKYTDSKAMRVWENAFTHPSFDPRRDRNYEVLEFMGDRALKYAFNKYLLRLDPDLDQGNLTTLDNNYMTKKNQPVYGYGLQQQNPVHSLSLRVYGFSKPRQLHLQFVQI